MPRQQVYGKRSRAIYDPFAVFASPQHVAKPTAEVQIPEVDEELSSLATNDETRSTCKTSVRRALGQRNANAVVRPVLSAEEEAKKRPGARRVVLDDAEDASSNERDGPCALDRESHRSLPKPKRAQSSTKGEGSPRRRPSKILSRDGQHPDLEPADLTAVLQFGGRLEWQEAIQAAATEDPSSAPAATTVIPTTPPTLDAYELQCQDLLALSHHPLTEFSDWSAQLSEHFSITKIAEASFGEVYRLSLLEHVPGLKRGDESVFKVIALKPPAELLPFQKRQRDAALRKASSMSAPSDVASEVKLLQRMSSIPGFTNFRDVRIVRGRPPQPFVQAFKAFNAVQKARKKELSTFADPARRTSYPHDQLWAVIEMQDAGTDLERQVENGECGSVWAVWDLFWQVALSLAKGEESAEFEHRDLHLGNICVSAPTGYDGDYIASAIEAKRKLGFTPLVTTLIDYTISRATMTSAHDCEPEIAFIDLAKDPTLFEGDSTDEYQYEIYRYMRSALFLDDAMANFHEARTATEALAGNATRSWQDFRPQTNLVWLHYVLYTLLEHIDWPSAMKAPLKRAKRQHAVWKRANDLEHVLLRLQNLLHPGEICKNEIESVRDLVGLALTEGWLDVEDVVGSGEEEEELELDSRLDALSLTQAAEAPREGANGLEVLEPSTAEKRPSRQRRRWSRTG